MLFCTQSGARELQGDPNCFENQRFPKVIQQKEDRTESFAEAITAFEDIIFIGGTITQPNLQPPNIWGDNWAHVGSIDTYDNMWLWSKVMTKNGQSIDDGLKSISALAVDPQGKNIAVHGGMPLSLSSNMKESYIFVLDAATGGKVSQLMAVKYTNMYQTVSSSGMLLQDDGKVVMALDQPSNPVASEFSFTMKFAVYDSMVGQIQYMKKFRNFYGHSASLTRGLGEYSTFIYLGGSSVQNETTEDWHLAFVKIEDLNDPENTSHISQLLYNPQSWFSTDLGFENGDIAPYITHMAFHNAYGFQIVPQLFGVAESNNLNGVGTGQMTLVWRVELDDGSFGKKGAATLNGNKLQIKKLVSLHAESYFIGMKETMQLDTSSNYWIHCILNSRTSSNPQLTSYYMKASPDVSLAIIQRIMPGSNAIGFEAVFVGSTRGTVGPQFSQGFKAYIAGQLVDYEAFQAGSTAHFTELSYAVWPTIEDDNSCVRYQEDDITPITTTNVESFKNIKRQDGQLENYNEFQPIIWAEFDFSDIVFQEQQPETECNSGDLSIVTVESGETEAVTICYNFGSEEIFNFNIDKSTNPQCDARWFYSTQLDSELPNGISLSVDSQGTQVKLAMQNGYDLGFDSTQLYPQTYTFEMHGLAMDGLTPIQYPLFFNIKMNCCYYPTVITAPVTLDGLTSYGYKIGDQPRSIKLINSDGSAASWKGDNSCCSAAIRQVIVTPSPPAGMFTQNSPSLDVIEIFSDDISIAESITYTVTIYAEDVLCDETTHVQYVVEVFRADEYFDEICEIVNPNSDLPQQFYYVGSEQSHFDIQTIALDGFYSDPSSALCGEIEFLAEVYFDATFFQPDGPHEVTQTSPVFQMDTTGAVQVYSQDSSLIGEHELHIQARLVNHSTVMAPVVVLPFIFERCSINLVDQPWILSNFTLTAGQTANYVLNEPIFEYINSSFNKVTCAYIWYDYSVNLSLVQGESSIDVASYVNFNKAMHTLTFQPKKPFYDIIIAASVTARLSDGLTVITAISQVTFQKQLVIMDEEKTAPYFVFPPEEMYYLTLDKNESEIISLGKINDRQSDKVNQVFICENCSENGAPLRYNTKQNTILVPKETPFGIYRIQLMISDDRKDDPMSSFYSFQIEVFVPSKEEKVKDEQILKLDEDENEEVEASKNEPYIILDSFSDLGELVVRFSQKLDIPQNLTKIYEDDALQMELIQHETSQVNERSVLAFSWNVQSFEQYRMTIKVRFNQPEYISQGLGLDSWIVTIKNSKYFFSMDTLQSIPVDTKDDIKVKKMMPDNSITKTFVSMTDGMNDLTQTVLVGNFVTNLFLSGSMHFLWGLIHCLQIVAHFPLINIMMPSNAHRLFQIIIQIAQFDIAPVEDSIEKGEQKLGIENDGFILSDNFTAFDLDSTDIIRNLQVMFLFIIFLLIIPIFLLLIRGLFCWSTKCMKCLNAIQRKIFWSVYIRFVLESFLELCIVSLLRFKNLVFDSSSDIFHSIASISFLTFLAFFMIGSCPFIITNLARLDQTDFKQKYGELYMGLKIKEKITTLYPNFFMLRRVIYAAILVFWQDQNYFQIQSVVFKTSLFMIYIGYFRPFQLPLTNRLELINETLTTVCTYSLIMFSAFVPDAETRYTCGWSLIGIVFLIITINIAVIIYQTISQIVRGCKLRYKRHKNRQLMRIKMNNFLKQLEVQKEKKEKELLLKTVEKFKMLEQVRQRKNTLVRQQGFINANYEPQLIRNEPQLLRNEPANQLQKKQSKDQYYAPGTINSDFSSRNCLQSVSSEEIKLEINQNGWWKKSVILPQKPIVQSIKKIPFSLSVNKIAPSPALQICDEEPASELETRRELLGVKESPTAMIYYNRESNRKNPGQILQKRSTVQQNGTQIFPIDHLALPKFDTHTSNKKLIPHRQSEHIKRLNPNFTQTVEMTNTMLRKQTIHHLHSSPHNFDASSNQSKYFD